MNLGYYVIFLNNLKNIVKKNNFLGKRNNYLYELLSISYVAKVRNLRLELLEKKDHFHY